MYRIYVFFTQNSMKTLYVLEELGVDYEFRFVNLFKGENRTEDFRKLSLTGKVPLLQHGDKTLFESGAICRYVANVALSPLYPAPAYERAQVDQWMDFFSCSLGRWLSTLYFENIIKAQVGMGEPDAKSCEEAQKFSSQQMAMVDGWLQSHRYLTGDQLSIADLFAFAYIEQTGALEISLSEFSKLSAWFDGIESRESISRARLKVSQQRGQTTKG